MQGLKIKTVTEQEFIVSGPVEYRDGVYYCGGASWPEEIVEKVLDMEEVPVNA